MKILRLLPLVGLLFISHVYADDTDIYLDTDAARANPPYLMLMIDYRPSVFSAFCKDLTECAGKMSENAFAKLCSIYTTTPEAICRTFHRDVDNGKTVTSQWAGGNYVK